MGPMPKKKSLTLQRVLVLLLAYIMLAVCGGVAASVLFVPGVVGANKAAKAVIPSLKVENVDFDVTSLPQKSTMYARDGSTVIATFYNQNRIVVPLKKISKTMQQAVVAREDRRFWTHAGVDVQGVMRAFVQTYLVKGSQQGGSSLTQQYVKNVLLMQAIEDDDSIAQYHATEDTIARKIREMLISVQMEKKYSKAEILQGYLNIAQFGNNLYGVETAAQRYFSVSAADLNVVQSATIAAITKNPSLYDPLVEENQKESENQRNIVLKLMLQEGYITQDQYTEAVNTPLKDTLKVQDVNVGCQDTGDYAYFCDFVVHRIQNSEEFGKTRAERNKLLQEGGLKIVTTLDVEANSTMMETARNTIPPDDPSGMEIAMAAVKPGTGEVLSFGLNRYYDATPAAANDPTRTSQNYAVDLADGGGSGWTIGSSWKPINLIAWMEAGHSINDNLQTSTSYPTTDFACSNYSGGADSWNVSNAMGAGTVNPESPFLGLVRSHNTTQASMGAILKLCKVADTATELGYHDAATGETIDKTQVYTPSMMIGSVNVSPLTMASIFAVYASNGVQCNPIAISKVTDKDGNDLKVPSANCHQAVDKDIIQTLAYTLNQGTVRPDGHSDWLTGVSRLVRPVPVRILRCPVDRSFLIRLRRSLWSAMHRTRTPTVFPTLPSTAGTTAIGMVRQSRLRPLPTSSIATFPRRKYRLTTITASPSRSTPRLASIWALADERSACRRPLRMATANRRAATISLSRRTLGKTTPKPRAPIQSSRMMASDW